MSCTSGNALTAFSINARTYSFDCSAIPEIVAGEQIVAINSVTSLPAGITIGPTSITDSGTFANVILSGGVPSTTYRIFAVLTLTDGSIVAVEGQLFIETP